MKRIFIYYSDSGNGDTVAEYLNNKGFFIRKAVPQKPMPKAFALKILKGGFLAGIGAKTELSGFDPDVSDFDEVVIGAPIWNGRTASPVNTVLEKTDLSGKKVTFVLYSGSGQAPKAEAKLLARFPNAKVIHLRSPRSEKEELNKLETL